MSLFRVLSTYNFGLVMENALKTAAENWGSKMPSVGTILAYLALKILCRRDIRKLTLIIV